MEWRFCNINDLSEEEYTAAYNSLSPSKKEHIDRQKATADKKRSLAAEILIKNYLCNDLNMENPIIKRAESGYPYIFNSKLHLSIAHSKEYVVFCIDDKPIGIDIEEINPITARLVERVCTKEEAEYVADNAERFFEIWTAKEAYFKMLKTGITDLKSVNALTLKRKLIKLENFLIQIVYN